MAYTGLEYFRRGTPPDIYFTYSYDMYRDGADVIISLKTDVSGITGWFYGYLNQEFYVDGSLIDSRTIKASNVSPWSAFSVETGLIRLSNKTIGNLAVTVRSITNDTDFEQTLDKNYSIAVPPAAATINAFSNFNIGSNTIINISNLGGLYNTIDFIAGGVTVKSIEGILSGAISTLITAADLYSKCPNSNTLQVTAQLKTWANSSKSIQVGSTQSANASAFVTNSNPIFNDFAFEDIDATVKSLTDSDQKLVSGYSDVRATITTANKAAAQNSATMDRYRLTIGAQTIEGAWSNNASVLIELSNVLSGIIKVEAIDSRGNITAVTKTATILSLTGIFFNSAEILRDNGADSTVKLNMSGKVHLLNFGTKINSLKSVKYQFKETSQSEDSYSSLTSIAASVDGSGNIMISNLTINGNLGASGFTIEKSYNIKLYLEDELTTPIPVLVVELLSGVYVLHLSRSGANAKIGIGKKATIPKGLDVAGSIYSDGADVAPAGLIMIWPLSTPPAGFILANGATNLSRTTYAKLFAVFGTTFGYSDSTHFGVPDMRKFVPVGYMSGDVDFGTLNAWGGSRYLQAHQHTVTNESGVNGLSAVMNGASGVDGDNWAFADVGTDGTFRNATFIAKSTGSGNAQNLQPYKVVNFIIKY